MADEHCKTLPCCPNVGSYYLYSLSNAGLYGNPLVPIPGGGVIVYEPPDGGPGMFMDITSGCCDGSASTSTVFVPKSTVAFQIGIQCCNGSNASGLITPGMSADQIQAVGLTMAIACTQSLDCPPDPNNPNPPPPGGPGGPFLVKLTCCDGLVVSGIITPEMDTIAISLLANSLVSQCNARKIFCGNPPEDPNNPNPPTNPPGGNPPNPDIYYPNYKVGNDPQTIPLCDDSTTLTAPDGLPSWASISGNNLTIAANQFFVVPASTLPSDIAAAKALANTQALAFLNAFAATALTTGFLVCVAPPSFLFVRLPDEEIPYTGNNPGGMTPAAGTMYYTFFGAVYSSVNGLNWAAISNTNCGAIGLAYGKPSFSPDTIFVACGFNVGLFGPIDTSLDALTWTNDPLVTAEQFVGVAFGGGVFVAISGFAGGKVARSIDGTFSIGLTGFGGSWAGIAYGSGPGLFVTVGDGGGIYTSVDGAVWNAQTSGVFTDLVAVAYENVSGLFVAVGKSSVLLTSPDGFVWTPRTGQTTGFKAVCAGGGFFFTLGKNDEVWQSTDGVNWSLFNVGLGGSIGTAFAMYFPPLTFIVSRDFPS